jgi:hypothetical protein
MDALGIGEAMNGNSPFAPDQIVNDSLVKCVSRTANAIYSNFMTEKSDEIFLIKSFDFLLIALEAPFAIRARSGDELRTFETGDTKGMIGSEREVELPAGVILQIFCRPTVCDTTCLNLLDVALDRLELISQAIAWYAESKAGDLGRRINNAINRLGDRGKAPRSKMAVVRAPRQSGNLKAIDRFFERLDPLVSSIGDLGFFPQKNNNDGSRPRLFFFHLQSVDDKSLMRLHLLKSQRSSSGSQYLEKAAEEPWAFADVVSKGLVSWIAWPSDHATYDGSNGEKAFNCYLDSLTLSSPLEGDVSGAGNHRGLAVPLHVGGIAWLVVLFVFAAWEDNYGELAYYINRGIVPTLFENIAGLARDEYLKLIQEDARSSFSFGKFDAVDLNARFEHIGPLFPYNEWYLSESKNEFEITAFNEIYYLQENARPLADDLLVIDFRTIRREAVQTMLQNAAREMELKIQREQESQQGADEGIGHALKNIVDLTNWTKAWPLLRSLIRNYDRLVVQDGTKEIIRRLRVASQSFGVFSLVAGLGHSARLAGAVSRGDYAKFADWHDAEELRRWTSGEIDDLRYIYKAYLTTVYRIVAPVYSSLSLDGKAETFEVACNDPDCGRTFIRWTGDEQDEAILFDKLSLHVPPFRKGSDAAYSFIFALTEPLVNAIRALNELKKNSDFSDEDRVLRIQISAHLPDEVVFSITNVTRRTVQGTLSGFERTRRMLRRLAIAEIDDLRFRELRPGAYEAISEVRFKPYDLAARIAKG